MHGPVVTTPAAGRRRLVDIGSYQPALSPSSARSSLDAITVPLLDPVLTSTSYGQAFGTDFPLEILSPVIVLCPET
jgi:hypothetical protein